MIGRQEERAELLSLAASDDPHFIVVYGRRRVGKTYLVRETFGDSFTFQFTGIAGSNLKEQLTAFVKALSHYGKTDMGEVNDWFDAFHELRGLIEAAVPAVPGKKIIFLDEMPWMDTHKSRFVQAFEHFWNGWASGRRDILLIACGSATAWITKKIFKAKGGLYNRVTRQMFLAPFTLAECRAYFDAKKIRIGDYDLMESYMIFGGIPYYLGMFEGKYSLAQNVDRMCFREGAPLRQEYDSLFHSVFNNPDKHLRVIETISGKKKGLTREEIVSGTGIADGGNLTKILSELELSGFIRVYKPFVGHKKTALYQLSDFFTSFYLTYMAGGESQNGHRWSASLDSGKHHAWSGYAFEQLCLAHIPQIRHSLGIDVIVSFTSSWRSRSSDNGAQIDLLIDRNDGIINLCEMKYTTSVFRIDKRYEENLRNKRGAFEQETKTHKAVHLTMITTFGVADNEHKSVIQSEVTMEDLLK
ncbi:MAG: ATP-binding protein [Clostridiales Family XIII bacterium]|nr:ATP-binding protein [Clostridiales Family XIII bacterium]